MRADRLLALLLLLQARGRTTAAVLAEELEVSVRTIYRDLQALSVAGVPVFAESGPGGGCELVAGYRSPLDALSRDEANALLILGVPDAIRDLGLEGPLTAAQERVRSATSRRVATDEPVVHLDMPRWFHRREEVPALVPLARAVQQTHRVAIVYRSSDGAKRRQRVIEPLGLVNKAGVWYVVAGSSRGDAVFRVSRVRRAVPTGESFRRPDGFKLADFWDAWSTDFVASRPHLEVTVRASPLALGLLPEVFGDAVRPAVESAGPADDGGWRCVVLTFEHVDAAVHRLSGFGALVEVVAPTEVREGIVTNARRTLDFYRDRG